MEKMEGNTIVMNALNPIKKLYNLYSDEEETSRITEMLDGESDMGDRPVDPFMDLQQRTLHSLTWDIKWDQQTSYRVPVRDTESYGTQTKCIMYKQQT